MRERIISENEFIKTTMQEDGRVFLIILKDTTKFNEIDLTGCKIIVSRYDFMLDELTEEAEKGISRYCKENGVEGVRYWCDHRDMIIEWCKNRYEMIKTIRSLANS